MNESNEETFDVKMHVETRGSGLPNISFSKQQPTKLVDPLSFTSLPLSDSRPPRPVYPPRKLLQPSLDHPNDYILEIDYSSLSKFMECPRQAENYLIKGREANKDNSATDFGHLFHSIDEQRLVTGGLTDAVKTRQHELIAEHFLTHQVPATDHRTQDRMVQTIKLYNERYANDGFPQKVLQVDGVPFVERPFKIELCTVEVNGVVPYPPHQLIQLEIDTRYSTVDQAFFIRNLHILYTGRIDAVLAELNNLLFVVDHKTSSRGGRTFEEAFRLSLQTRGYCWAAQKLLHREIAGLIMNAVIVRPLTKTGTGTEFNRITYFYRQDQLQEFEDCIKATVSQFISALVLGFFPQYARSFKSPCEMCDYQENCSLPISQREADLASELYRDVTWNPIH